MTIHHARILLAKHYYISHYLCYVYLFSSVSRFGKLICKLALLGKSSLSYFLTASSDELQSNAIYLYDKQGREVTHRRTDPHIAVNVITTNNPSLAHLLLGAVQVLEAAAILAQGEVCAVLPARSVRVHVHLVLDVALE